MKFLIKAKVNNLKWKCLLSKKLDKKNYKKKHEVVVIIPSVRTPTYESKQIIRTTSGSIVTYGWI